MAELLLVGVGVMGRPYVTAARRLGLGVHAVETPDRADALDGEVDRVTVAAGHSDEAWAAAAAEAAARHRPDGVVAFAEQHTTAAALVADRFGLPGPSTHAAVLARNKALQRGTFAVAGVRQPEYRIVTDPGELRGWASGRFPVVVKPLDGTGSEGVELVVDAAELAASFDRPGRRPLLVEQAVDGPEYSLEALVRDGVVLCRNVTRKETTGPPRFVETGHRIGGEPDLAAREDVAGFASAVLGALGMVTGIAHLEFRMTPDGPTLMEVAVRTPGDFLMDLLGFAWGFDWFEMVVRLAMGMPLPELAPRPSGHAAGWFPITAPGRVTAIERLDAVRAHPSVAHAAVLAGVGDLLPAVTCSADRRIAVLVAAPDPAGVDDGLGVARTELAVRTEPV